MAKSAKKTSARRSMKTAKQSPAKRSSTRNRWADETKLSIVAKENPGREGSAAYKIFDALKSCKTIGAARAKTKRLESREGHLTTLLAYWKKRGEVSTA